MRNTQVVNLKLERNQPLRQIELSAGLDEALPVEDRSLTGILSKPFDLIRPT